jgi:hypothetical protein
MQDSALGEVLGWMLCRGSCRGCCVIRASGFPCRGTVFDAMVDGWRTQMLARGLVTATIPDAVSGRHAALSGSPASIPGNRGPVDVEDFLAERRCGQRPITLTTLRADSNAVASRLSTTV